MPIRYEMQDSPEVRRFRCGQDGGSLSKPLPSMGRPSLERGPLITPRRVAILLLILALAWVTNIVATPVPSTGYGQTDTVGQAKLRALLGCQGVQRCVVNGHTPLAVVLPTLESGDRLRLNFIDRRGGNLNPISSWKINFDPLGGEKVSPYHLVAPENFTRPANLLRTLAGNIAPGLPGALVPNRDITQVAIWGRFHRGSKTYEIAKDMPLLYPVVDQGVLDPKDL